MTNNLIKLAEWDSDSNGIRRIADIVREEIEHLVDIDLEIQFPQDDVTDEDIDTHPYFIAAYALQGMLIEALGGKYLPAECPACILMDQLGKDPIHKH